MPLSSPNYPYALVTVQLVLFPDSLKRLVVGLLVHEAAIWTALRPSVVLRVVNLRPISNSTIPVPVAFRRIRRHVFLLKAGRQNSVAFPIQIIPNMRVIYL